MQRVHVATACLALCVVFQVNTASAATTIIELDFTDLGLPQAPNEGDTALFENPTISFGNLDLNINGFVSANTVNFVSYTKGKGLGAFDGFSEDTIAINGDDLGEAINILFRSSIASDWDFAMHSLTFIDENSDSFAFEDDRWTVYQGNSNWVNDRDVLNRGPNSNRIANYDARASNGNGNGQINQARANNGRVLINPSRSFEERIPGFYGINIHSGRDGTAIFLAGMSIEIEEADAENLGLLAPIPLPAPLGMLPFGFAGLGVVRHCRRRAS